MQFPVEVILAALWSIRRTGDLDINVLLVQ